MALRSVRTLAVKLLNVTHGRLLRASTAPCPVAMVSSTASISKAYHVSQVMNYRQSVVYTYLDHFGKSFQLKTVRLLRTELARRSNVRYANAS